jgi:hypothetical protein
VSREQIMEFLENVNLFLVLKDRRISSPLNTSSNVDLRHILEFV